jgi:hypothetical protein
MRIEGQVPGEGEKFQRRQVIIKKSFDGSAVLDPTGWSLGHRVASISATALMPAAPEDGGTARRARRVQFALRGDVVDLTVGVIIGGAILASVADDIITTTFIEIS